jgi:hypothetical protein
MNVDHDLSSLSRQFGNVEVAAFDLYRRTRALLKRASGRSARANCARLLKRYPVESVLELFGGSGSSTVGAGFGGIYRQFSRRQTIVEFDTSHFQALKARFKLDPNVTILQGDSFKLIKELGHFDLIDLDANGISYPNHHEFFDLVDDAILRCDKILALTCIIEFRNKWQALYLRRSTPYVPSQYAAWYKQRVEFYGGRDRIDPAHIERVINSRASRLQRRARLLLFDYWTPTHARVYFEIART